MPKTKLLTTLILTLLWALSIKIFSENTDSNLLNSFSKSKESEVLSLLTHFDSSKRLLVFVPNFDANAQTATKEIAAKLSSSQLFESVFFRLIDADRSLKQYLKTNYLYIADANLSKLNNIENEINRLKKQSEDPFNYMPIDKNDPFGVFDLKTGGFGFQNGMLAASNKGYLIIAVAKSAPTDAEGAKKLHDYCKNIEKNYENTVFFAPHFFVAENSKNIENRVKILSIFSIVALIAIYIFILKNPKLLLLCLTVLGFSVSAAAALTSIVYGQIATLVLAFGAGIASIAEDYLFLLYLNRNLENKSFNKEVFVGFVATFCSLLAMSVFADGLIAQISFFTACSIAFSYLAFSYLPRVYDFRSSSFFEFSFKPKSVLHPLLVSLISIAIIAFASLHIKADFELQNLDYDNKELKAKATFFVHMLGDQESVLIEAASKEELLQKTSTIKQKYIGVHSIADFCPSKKEIDSRNNQFAALDLDSIKQLINKKGVEVGFKDGYFKDSYSFLSHPSFVADETAVKKIGYEILTNNDKYYTIAQIPRTALPALKLEFKDIYTPKELSQNISKKEFEKFILPSLIATFIIIGVLVFKTGKNFLFAFNFILFPLAVLSIYLSFASEGVNLMHIFGIFLISIYGIDYGIYLEKSMNSVNIRAVLYSLSTTFAGFGILIFSDIKAVSSIGEAVCIGIVCALLMIFQKRAEHED